jgi:hypothetical protein
MVVAGRISTLAYEDHPASIAVDEIGVGAGVVDRLREMRIDGVVAVNVGDPAFDRERFLNRRAELYWGLREWFRNGEIALKPDEALKEELAGIRYSFHSNGKIKMEEKSEMKKRIGRSPDRADMLAMLFDSSCEWVGGASAGPESALVYSPPSPSAILRREMEVW